MSLHQSHLYDCLSVHHPQYENVCYTERRSVRLTKTFFSLMFTQIDSFSQRAHSLSIVVHRETKTHNPQGKHTPFQSRLPVKPRINRLRFLVQVLPSNTFKEPARKVPAHLSLHSKVPYRRRHRLRVIFVSGSNDKRLPAGEHNRIRKAHLLISIYGPRNRQIFNTSVCDDGQQVTPVKTSLLSGFL